MAEQSNPGIEHLLNPSSAQLQQEADLVDRGFIPERLLQIEAAEIQRLRAGLEQAIGERTKDWTEVEVASRRETARKYFSDLMESPSFLNGPYAASRWLNLYEIFPRIIDIQEAEATVPDIDTHRSLGLSKRDIVSGWLVDRIQSALPKDQSLKEFHLSDYFTNVTPQQLNVVADQIAKSGLTLMENSPTEHWQRLVTQEMRNRTLPADSDR